MMLLRTATSLAFLITTAWALQESGQTASLCPTCYTHTIIARPPEKTCPPLPIHPIPGPACGNVCVREVADHDAESAAMAAIVPPVTIPRATTVTVGTVTATIPGRNPVCPTTATVTVTRARPGPTPDLICPLAHLPDCACDAATRTTLTVVGLYTVSETATVFTTGTPLTCAFLPTTTQRSQEPSASASSACTSYSTQWESVLCLDGKGANTAASPQITEALIPDTVVKGVPISLLYTRDCTVHVVDRSAQCPERGV